MLRRVPTAPTKEKKGMDWSPLPQGVAYVTSDPWGPSPPPALCYPPHVGRSRGGVQGQAAAPVRDAVLGAIAEQAHAALQPALQRDARHRPRLCRRPRGPSHPVWLSTSRWTQRSDPGQSCRRGDSSSPGTCPSDGGRFPLSLLPPLPFLGPLAVFTLTLSLGRVTDGLAPRRLVLSLTSTPRSHPPNSSSGDSSPGLQAVPQGAHSHPQAGSFSLPHSVHSRQPLRA